MGGGDAGGPDARLDLVVADASPLIALIQLRLLETVAPLFAELLIPPAVAREIAPSGIRPNWIVERSPRRPFDVRLGGIKLGPGESEAIGLALELGTHTLLLDERRARRLAAELGLRIIGTVGLLVAAKQAGLIVAVRPYLETLLAVGFHVAPQIIEGALREAGEAP